MALNDILLRIRAAEAAAGRPERSVTLIAVSKVQPPERVRAVLEAGQRIFGENYVQEAQGKWPDWRAEFPGVELHMVGPLQSNKAKVAAELFDAIHTLDRASLAGRLARLADGMGRQPQLFVQVNTGSEPQKAGVLPESTDAFVAACRADGLRLDGAMCIPPEGEDPTPHFRLLRAIAEANGLPGLSMGMSADFEIAIAEGATHVRVGSAIFGERDYPAV
ncbi:YggS family pyridoxal phosphate-dependent enzyme [Paracoccus sp. Z118]|uniref:YggS family pyridoxal phosphate-dependent enzyme n=1 Tax=Paracoccus sp. Z118 TaxID=2851017 RepID=UPI001C2C35D9|nr:YggS family pyridoxal phosphate-dependent enzyme [Paracoccus sp. Z118]MBV0891218.1 YggS family pyridoxal phosphate-dependent enzyme [Paracoccus sp. Z118]